MTKTLGFTGRKHSPESRARMSASHQKYRKEVAERLSKANKGKPKSEEHKKKLSEIHKNLWTIEKRLEWAARFQDQTSDYAEDDGRLLACRLYPYPLGPCEWCHEREARDRHHIDRNTRNNRRENLLFLCKFCHEKTRIRRGRV